MVTSDKGKFGTEFPNNTKNKDPNPKEIKFIEK
jgi:hypothetical protein